MNSDTPRTDRALRHSGSTHMDVIRRLEALIVESRQLERDLKSATTPLREKVAEQQVRDLAQRMIERWNGPSEMLLAFLRLLKRREGGWKVVRDGPSLAMLEAPDGRVFRLEQLGTINCRNMWGNPADNDELCDRIAGAL